MKKVKEIIIYDTTDYAERYNEIRKQIYDQFVEEYGWDFIEEVPDDMIYAEMNDQDDIDYQYFKDKFTQLLKNGYCLLVGTCGRWNGSVRGGKFIASFDDLYNAIQHLDYLRVVDRNGHLFIEGYHHDGSDSYEIKQLTAKGYQYADSNYFATSRKLHDNIMNCNLFSKLPRLASI